MLLSYNVQGCLERLAKKFPKSPRVDVLQGIRIEASERPDVALQYYDQLLDADPSNAVGYLCLFCYSFRLTRVSSQAVWKRRISVLRRAGKLEEAVEELSQYLDTFYSDLEAWLELADIYSSCFL